LVEDGSILNEVAALAAGLGPALQPEAHNELLVSITDAARAIFDAAACSLALLDEERANLTFHVASGEGAEDVVGMTTPATQGIAGWVVASGQPISIDEVTRDPRFARDFAQETGYVPTSILAMPLETDDEVIGVIEVLDRRHGAGRGQDDMTTLALFARQAALAIENSRVFTDLGRVLFEAVGQASEDRDLNRALTSVAESAPGPRAEMAGLAANLNVLMRAGDNERDAAARILAEFARYIRMRSRRW
jgi:GAF domain-containing protein